MTGLTGLPATFTTGQARDAGVHPRDLYRWRDAGQVVELSRGVFRRTDAPEASYPELLALAHRVPVAVVCLVSAAAIHDLTDEQPRAVQFAVPRGTRSPRIAYPPVEAHHFDAATFELGLAEVQAAPGESMRVYSPARTVVDLMRLRRRIGEPLALAALRRHLASPGSSPGRLLEVARALDVLGPVRAAVDVLEAS
ncbi:MAG: type IV toxin-antitoxin system AbiEi family antitoxin domain-containing protein [Actinomycetales bacterium]|nr:type IV toxin-antitoxin system AbiEi family antitoxin domain-containing protein [Actinomycetales bacterium]